MKSQRARGRGGIEALAAALRAPAALVLLVSLCAGSAVAQDSFDHLVRQAQLALDTGRLDEAASLFERAATTDPARVGEIASDRAWAYMRLGNDAIVLGKNETADRYYTMAAAIYPEYKKIFIDQWTFTRLMQAKDALEEASRNPRRADWKSIEKDLTWVRSLKPGEADVHYLLGSLYEMQGKNDQARREFAAALGGKPVSRSKSLGALRNEVSRGLRGRRYVFELRPGYPPRQKSDPGPFQNYRRGRFVIHHHNIDLARRVGAVLEYYLTVPVLDGVLSSVDRFPDECNVYIFADEQEFQAAGGKEIWAGAQSKITVLNGRIVSAVIQLFQTTPELTESAVPHELAHLRLAMSTYFFAGMPLWLQEGVATSTESRHRKANAADTLAKARDQGILISLDELFAMKAYPKERTSEIFYAEGLAVAESLAGKYGKQEFQAFMTALRDNDAAAALRQVYGLTVVDIEDMVLEWATAHERPRL